MTKLPISKKNVGSERGEGGVEVWFGNFRTQTQKNCLLINLFIGCWIPIFDVFLTSDLAGNMY